MKPAPKPSGRAAAAAAASVENVINQAARSFTPDRIRGRFQRPRQAHLFPSPCPRGSASLRPAPATTPTPSAGLTDVARALVRAASALMPAPGANSL